VRAAPIGERLLTNETQRPGRALETSIGTTYKRLRNCRSRREPDSHLGSGASTGRERSDGAELHQAGAASVFQIEVWRASVQSQGSAVIQASSGRGTGRHCQYSRAFSQRDAGSLNGVVGLSTLIANGPTLVGRTDRLDSLMERF
jgi:hypothetical protein